MVVDLRAQGKRLRSRYTTRLRKVQTRKLQGLSGMWKRMGLEICLNQRGLYVFVRDGEAFE